jgi:hypothetical protein
MATKSNASCDAFWITWYWCAWRYVVRISSSIFSSAWKGIFARLHKNEVTRNYSRGGVGTKMCMANWSLPHCWRLPAGIGGKRIEWYAKRGQPGKSECSGFRRVGRHIEMIGSCNYLFWPMDRSLDLTFGSVHLLLIYSWLWCLK